jgi:hypothetical protein
MNKNVAVLTILFVVFTSSLSAQFKIELFSGVAVNPVDQPFLATAGFSPGYEYKGFLIDYAMDFNINNRAHKVINAFSGNLAYEFSMFKNLAKINLFYCNKPISQMMIINNTGLKLDYRLRKWAFSLGNNFNIYKFNDNAVEVYGITDNHYLLEAANLMYSVKYNVMEEGNPWNVFVNLTNFEKFIIEQEINPMLNLGFTWQKDQIAPQLFTDFWYQTAGFNNIRVNYFGWFIRIGIKWEIN